MGPGALLEGVWSLGGCVPSLSCISGNSVLGSGSLPYLLSEWSIKLIPDSQENSEGSL